MFDPLSLTEQRWPRVLIPFRGRSCLYVVPFDSVTPSELDDHHSRWMLRTRGGIHDDDAVGYKVLKVLRAVRPERVHPLCHMLNESRRELTLILQCFSCEVDQGQSDAVMHGLLCPMQFQA
eukprot:2020616-Rhodomonas_salina.1